MLRQATPFHRGYTEARKGCGSPQVTQCPYDPLPHPGLDLPHRGLALPISATRAGLSRPSAGACISSTQTSPSKHQWARAAHRHRSVRRPFRRCENLSPQWELAPVKSQRGCGRGEGCQDARAQPATSTARLTWTGRARGLGLQGCGLSLREAGVRGLGLFSGLHVSEGTCRHSPRGVVRRCPPQPAS